jgi:hypothetical protein
MAKPKSTLLTRLAKLAEVAVQGTLVETYVKCGTPTCGCAEDATRRHGPHTYLKFRDARGKATALYVPKRHVGDVRRAVDAWSALWDTSVALGDANREALRTRLRRRADAE